MFTGLVAGIGRVAARRESEAGVELAVDLGELAASDPEGASIALSGVCCTLVRWSGRVAEFVLSPETLRRTWFDQASEGDLLNIERPLRAGEPFGGHMVQGHVDGLGTVRAAVDAGAGGELEVELPAALLRYCVEKGSIALDGVSLTIAERRGGDRLMLAVIPHTAQVTTIGSWIVGQSVNVEVDILAKYVEQLVAPYRI